MSHFYEALTTCVTWGAALIVTSVVAFVVLAIVASAWTRFDDWRRRF